MDLSSSGKTIAKLRKSAGFTQASLAERLGISDKAVSKWERGMSFPDTSLLNRLCILLDTDIESILYGQEQSNHGMGILILDKNISPEIIVYNKPLIHYLISQFLLVGIREIVIVGKCIPLQLKDIKITIVPTLNQRFTKNKFVIYGNQFLYGPNLTKHFMRAMSRKSLTVIAAMKAKGDYALKVDNDRKAVLSNEFNINKYYALPYVFNTNVEKIRPFEEIVNERVNVETMVRGTVHFNLNCFEKLYEMAGFIRMMEENTGEKIADITDIVERRTRVN